MEALQSGVGEIEVQGTLSGMPMITLPPGVRLRGGTLRFGAKGLRLTSDNVVEGVTVVTADEEVAILNDTSVSELGTLTLRDVRTSGQVLLLADDAVRAGHVLVEGLTVERADVRGRVERPGAFGVEALQGAFTLWNYAIHTRDDVPASTTCRSTPPTERTSSEPPDPDFAGPS